MFVKGHVVLDLDDVRTLAALETIGATVEEIRQARNHRDRCKCQICEKARAFDVARAAIALYRRYEREFNAGEQITV